MTHIFTYPDYGTPDNFPHLTVHSGQSCIIVRELGDDERDPEVGRMFVVRFNDGTEGTANDEELNRIPVVSDRNSDCRLCNGRGYQTAKRMVGRQACEVSYPCRPCKGTGKIDGGTETEPWCNHDAPAIRNGVCECGEIIAVRDHTEMLDQLYQADVLTKAAWLRARRKLYGGSSGAPKK